MIEQLLQNQVLVGLSGASIIGAVLFLLRNAPQQLLRLFLNLFSVEVLVKNDDVAFEWLVLWLSRTRYATKARRVRLTSGDSKEVPVAANQPDNGAKSSYLLSPGLGLHVFSHAGTLVALARAEVESKGSYRPLETLALRVLSSKRGVLTSLIDEAQALAMQENENVLVVYGHQYQNWHIAARRPLRAPDSVILAGRLLEDIIADAQEFAGMGPWYAQRGVPWRRGYLLYGPPGCGKTSVVAAIASVLRRPVCMVSLNAVQSDGVLLELMRMAPAGGVLLIEDLDTAFKEKGTRETRDGEMFTMAGVLNALDGVASQEGRIVFITTNHRERLDPALIRAGRCDREFHIGPATQDQAERMFLRFFPGNTVFAAQFGILAAGASLAEIQGHLLANRKNRLAAAMLFRRKAA